MMLRLWQKSLIQQVVLSQLADEHKKEATDFAIISDTSETSLVMIMLGPKLQLFIWKKEKKLQEH